MADQAVWFTMWGVLCVFVAACFSAYYKYLFRVRGDELRSCDQTENYSTRKLWWFAIAVVSVQTVFDLLAVNFLSFTLYAVASTSPTITTILLFRMKFGTRILHTHIVAIAVILICLVICFLYGPQANMTDIELLNTLETRFCSHHKYIAIIVAALPAPTLILTRKESLNHEFRSLCAGLAAAFIVTGGSFLVKVSVSLTKVLLNKAADEISKSLLVCFALLPLYAIAGLLMIEYAFSEFLVVIVATVYGVFGIITSQFLGIELFNERPENDFLFYPSVCIILICSCILQAVQNNEDELKLTGIETINTNKIQPSPSLEHAV